MASAHRPHGVTVDDDCLIEGKGGCKDLGTVTAGSVEACYEVSVESVLRAKLAGGDFLGVGVGLYANPGAADPPCKRARLVGTEAHSLAYAHSNAKASG